MGDFMIIKTKKMSAREVKKKLHDFIDSISEDCGPEVEEMAEELKAHGDDFVEALNGMMRGADYRDNGMNYRHGGRAWHRSDSPNGMGYRNEGSWEEREELRKRNEQELKELDRKMQELKMRMRDSN